MHCRRLCSLPIWFRCVSLLTILLVLPSLSAATAAEPATISTPTVLDADWQIERVASEPQLVTPVACCFDSAGRLLVIECHTHFPPQDYPGPKQDRIYLFDDSDGNGSLDRQRLFYEGGTATMGITPLEDGWIAVATRSEVVRIRDSDGDDRADQRELLLKLNTKAEYPHNGLTGLAVGPDGRLYVGQGENFGEPYELVAADQSRQVGSGEGGNIFCCDQDGSSLERVATGFWNPFGIHFDVAGRLWTVGNDPDSKPPCRLLHVADYGDYGFQFRFGRAGIHPLLSWNGEYPGTLPMTAATGEAPCLVISHGEHLWVTGWGDNRIERYALTPNGASWNSETEVVVQGDASFRPVGIATAPDGSIYITDWADRSYPVHGKGRLWRLSRKRGAGPTRGTLPPRTAAEQRAATLANDPTLPAAQRLAALDERDPFLRQAALAGLVRTDQLKLIERQQAATPRQRVGLLTAWRWIGLATPDRLSESQRQTWTQWALDDPDPQVVMAGLRWASERGDRAQLPRIRRLLDRTPMSPTLFSSLLASIAYLETGSAAKGKRDPAIEKLLLQFASDPGRSAALRSYALERLPAAAPQPTDEQLVGWLQAEPDRSFGRQVVRLLAARQTDTSMEQLARIAAEAQLDPQTRADAVAALSSQAEQREAELQRLDTESQPQVVRQEVRRVYGQSDPEGATAKPPAEDLQRWQTLVGSGGDVDAGRRVFFRTRCASCHAHSGRGADTGPDLTQLPETMTTTRLLESILQPSKEVGPMYVPWRVLTTDGRVLTGIKLNAGGVGTNLRYQSADGTTFELPLKEIETQESIAQSIMPAGLQDTLTIAELRDLIAFLQASP